MQIDKKEVIKIAKLARLAADDSEVDEYATNLSKILNLVNKMDEYDTDNIQPLSHPMNKSLRRREDIASNHNERDKYLELAPKHEAGLFLVPKVIEV